MPDALSQSPEIAQAFTIANEAGLSATELELQWRRKDFIYLQRDSIALAAEEGEARGREQGLEQGLEQGREEAKLAIARRLLASGMSAKQAAELAGISEQLL
jgi:predicted transposase/invertase (TIGR01784 family)